MECEIAVHPSPSIEEVSLSFSTPSGILSRNEASLFVPTDSTTNEEGTIGGDVADTRPTLLSPTDENETTPNDLPESVSVNVNRLPSENRAVAETAPHPADVVIDSVLRAWRPPSERLMAIVGKANAESQNVTVAKPDQALLPESNLPKVPLPPASHPSIPPRLEQFQLQAAQSTIAENSPPSRSGEERGSVATPLPANVTLGVNDVQATNANVILPKGEGYEAIISANSQGKLIALGVLAKQPDGSPRLDADGNPVFVPLKLGMKVQKGDLLGQQFNREFLARKVAAERELEVGIKEAEKTLEIEVAFNAEKVAKFEYEGAITSNRLQANSVAQEEVNKRAFEWNRSRAAYDKALYDQEVNVVRVKVNEAQIQIAEAQLEERSIVSPIDGQIDDIKKNEGEWLREGDEILKIIRLDKVQVTAKIDASLCMPEDAQGKPVTVWVNRSGGAAQKIDGVITYARPTIDFGSYTVYAEVENVRTASGGWVLNPGAMVNLVLHK